MSWSMYLGKIKGTKIFIHWTFFILVAWVFFQDYYQSQNAGQGLLGVLFIFTVFTCITLHEFGHALVAKRYGCATEKITLLPIGGVAKMKKIPEKPAQEFWMALAGPWVNVIIAATLYIVLMITGGIPVIKNITALTPSNFLYALFFVNLLLAVFNLIPAFPMDGGRVLRALLAMKMKRVKATRIASLIGQGIAILFVFFGFFANIWLVFIGVFIFIGAGGEAKMEETRSILKRHVVRDALMRRFPQLVPGESIHNAVQQLLDGQEKEFVIAENGNVEGMLTHTDLLKALSQKNENAPVSSVMRKNYLALDSGLNLQEAFEKMVASGQSVCPVFENQKLVGVIDMDNINEFILVGEARNM